MNGVSASVRRWLGRGWVLAASLVASCVMFGYLVPAGVGGITRGRTLAPKILDEYLPTWSRADAASLFDALGPVGREAYCNFYLHLDFWFPVLSLTIFYASLLSFAFPAPSRLAWMNVTPVAMYVSDALENVTHFTMAREYPARSDALWTVGPYFTLSKWIFLYGLLGIALAGLAARAVMAISARR